LAAKSGQLGDDAASIPVDDFHADADARLTLINREGLHIRPASSVVEVLAPLDARVRISRAGMAPASANSPTALLALGARRGDVLVVEASGPQAFDAIEALRRLVDAGFGELDAGEPDAAPTAPGALGVSPGRAFGPVLKMPEPPREPPAAAPLPAESRDAEARRIAPAATSVQTFLTERAARLDGPAADIVSATAAMAGDPGLLADSEKLVVDDGETAERAVCLAIAEISAIFAGLGGLTAERVADLRDVRDRIVAQLSGLPVPGIPVSSTPFVLVARDLSPADTALLDPRLCVALVTVEGGPTSHTAILARSLGLPAVVAMADAMSIPDGTIVLVNGSDGVVLLDPTDDDLLDLAAGQTTDDVAFDGHGRTLDGHEVELFANVASPASVGDAVAAGAEGVGLFRTEFCFLDRATAPTVEEQVTAYRAVLGSFAGKRVIVRTLDAGADKPLAFVTDDEEANPALGIRGIRTSWRRPELLAQQLEAIGLAAAAENAIVGVMAPMIATADEAAGFAALCARHGLDLAGVMIETPAAALTTDEILKRVDFVSLGTNDLTQYTMAADRLVGALARLNDPWQPAVLRMIAAACSGAAASGKPVGVCGEAASDPQLAAVLVGLGVRSLSMAPRSIARVSQQLRRVSLETCQDAARAALAAPTPGAARAAARGLLGA
jgi:phosphotransferase system enzyme I (PtsI)